MSEYDPTDLKDLDRRQADKAARSKASKDTEEEDIKWLMKTKQGRRVMWTLLERCGTFGDPFNTNAMLMASNAGQQRVGRAYFATVQSVAPEQYLPMVKEAKERNDN